MTAAFLPRHRFPPILSLPAGRIGAANILALVFERLGNGRNWKRGPSRTGYKRDLAGWLRVVRRCWRCGGDHAERYLRYAIGHHRIDLFNNRASWPEVEQRCSMPSIWLKALSELIHVPPRHPLPRLRDPTPPILDRRFEDSFLAIRGGWWDQILQPAVTPAFPASHLPESVTRQPSSIRDVTAIQDP